MTDNEVMQGVLEQLSRQRTVSLHNFLVDNGLTRENVGEFEIAEKPDGDVELRRNGSIVDTWDSTSVPFA